MKILAISYALFIIMIIAIPYIKGDEYGVTAGQVWLEIEGDIDNPFDIHYTNYLTITRVSNGYVEYSHSEALYPQSCSVSDFKKSFICQEE